MPEAANHQDGGRTRWHQGMIAVVASVVMFTNLGGPRLWDRDEPRNAGCAREMLQRGDWVVPVFNDELRAHKPVLLYWLIMAAYAVFGVSEFAARCWSAVLAVGTALATYHIGRRLFSAQVGLWAGIILATSLMFDVAGRAATPDSVLIFFSTMALLVYVLAAIPGDGRHFPKSWPAVVAMYAMMGLAVLAKGPVGFVLPTAVIGMFLLVRRLPEMPQAVRTGPWHLRLLRFLRPFAPVHFLRTCWLMRPFTALAVVGAVTLPWYVWVGGRTDGEFLRQFFWEYNLGRAAQPMEGHDGSLLFYPVAILVGFFPWSVFAAPTAIGLTVALRRRGPWHPGYVLAVCWVGVYVGLFSLAQTKLPSYVTPCYPALALLTACFVVEWMRGCAPAAPLWPKLALVTLGVVGVAMLVGLPFATQRILPGEAGLAAIGLIPVVGAVTGLVLVRRTQLPQAAFVLAGTAILLATAAFGLALVRVERHQQNHLLLAAIARTGGSPRVGAFGRLEPTWVFYGERPIVELARGSGPADSKTLVSTSPRRLDAAEFFEDGKDAFIITTDRHWDELRTALPRETTVLAECPLFLRSERLLLVGLPPPAPATARRESNSRLPRH